MQKQVIKGLFKPYVLRFQTINDLKGKSTRLDKIVDNITHVDVDRKIKNQCSKSADRTCANKRCPHNLLKYDYFDGVEDV